MSKINKLRFVNLNYNYNTMKIDDETFFLNGESTMLNLRNGGGKSVLVQMSMAPFVSKSKRSTKDRAFESYFTTKTPTYILVEWKLDDGGGYLLTGMMVRKKDAIADENSKEKLDIINFIHEYKGKNEYDIDNIPIVTKTEGSKVVKSFTSSKALFEELKKKRELKFTMYDMNNSVTAKNYFDRLEEYKINRKEWETIIKQINLKESGLSELFTKAKNSSGLVKEWFLPAVENKLSGDENRIKNYRNLIDKYIKEYKKTKSSIDKKEKLDLFSKLSEEIMESVEGFIGTVNKKEEYKNHIANLIEHLREKEGELSIKEEEIDLFIEGLNEEINELKYEEASIAIYNQIKKVDSLEAEKNEKTEKVSKSKEKIARLTKEQNTLECAKVYERYKSLSQEIQKNESKLRVIKNEFEKDAPYINDLGYTLGKIYKDEIECLKGAIDKKKEEKIKGVSERDKLSISLKEARKNLKESSRDEGGLRVLVESFDRVEESFNSRFKEGLSRNIEGYFDEKKLVAIEKGIEEEKDKLIEKKKKNREKLIELEESIKKKESEKEKAVKLEVSNAETLKTKEKIKSEYDEEIKKRASIIKYIDFDESKVFEKEKIIDSFNGKIGVLRDEEERIKKKLSDLRNEVENLKNSKVIEIPEEIENELKSKEIKLTYGMEWLKKNGYSLEKNEELVKKNPFIPYSLVMDTREIETLQREPMDIFTSFPIPIINRTELEKACEELSCDLVSLNGVNFLVSFNNKLLNEEELLKLIKYKEDKEELLCEELKKKKEAIELYEEKRNIVWYQKVCEELYSEVNEEIKSLREKSTKIKEMLLSLVNVIGAEKQEQASLTEKDKEIEDMQRKIDTENIEFKRLKEAYEEYKENNERLNKLKGMVELFEGQIKTFEEKIEDINSRIEGYNEEISNTERQLESSEREGSIYKVYADGKIIPKDKEDIVAEYKALKSKITESEKELEEKIRELTDEFNKRENELSLKSDRYGIFEEAYIREIYDVQRELNIHEELRKEREYNSEATRKLGIASSDLKNSIEKLEDLNKDLLKVFKKEAPKDSELLTEKNFLKEIGILSYKIKEKEAEKKDITTLKGEVHGNLASLNEYYDLEIVEKEEISLNLENLNTDIGKRKRDFRNILTDEEEKEKQLSRLVYNLDSSEQFKNDSLFNEPIYILKSLISKPKEFKKQLDLTLSSYVELEKKITFEIEFVEKEEGKVLESLLEYIETIHNNIGKIDDNSSIKIGNKNIKMLSIQLSLWDENKEVYRLRLKEYIEQIRNQAIKNLEKNEGIEEIISNNINTTKLYDEVVGISNVTIKLYKIEEDKQRQITWDEVSKNSGGEGFLSAFVILSSLLSYMRKDENDIFTRKESGKVLIMDNPFAQTSSAHLLKPLMDIAKKSNTQLICLTGLGGDSIYNRFDNIYVLNLIPSKLKSGLKFLKSEHTKGEEDTEILVASRMKIEEQIRLF